MATKLTTSQLDDALTVGNLKRIGSYVSTTVPMAVRCMSCGAERSVTPGRLLYSIRQGKKPCPSCAGLTKRTDASIDDRLKDKQIKRLSPYENDITPMWWQCTDCGHKWQTRVTKITNDGTGCPVCSYKERAANRTLSPDEISKHLEDRGLDMTTPYVTLHTKATWECHKCHHNWVTSAYNVIYKNTGCPHCAPDGVYGKKVVVDGMKFDSRLEYSCYKVLTQMFPDKTIDRQVRYPHNSRKRADFVIPDMKLWIEVSSFTLAAYLAGIEEKRAVTDQAGNLFIFANSPRDLKRQLDKLT